MRIRSGDTLEVHTESGREEYLAELGERASRNLRDIVSQVPQELGPHIMTGPVAVEDAEPGDVLEVRIHEVKTRYDWGYNSIRPMMGGLPEDFPYTRTVIVDLDLEAQQETGARASRCLCGRISETLVWLPPPSVGRVGSYPPGAWGGNLDNKELISGSIAYFPIFQRGRVVFRRRWAWLPGRWGGLLDGH